MNGYGSAPVPEWRPWLLFGLMMIAAGTLQSLLAYPLFHWIGSQPDLLLTVALCAALLSDAVTGAFLGFAAGLFTASLVGQTLGTYLVSRTLAGYVAGRFTTRLFQANAPVIVIGVLVASLSAAALQGLAAPPHRSSLGIWLRTMAGGAAWNAAFALPVAALLRRAGWGGDTN